MDGCYGMHRKTVRKEEQYKIKSSETPYGRTYRLLNFVVSTGLAYRRIREKFRTLVNTHFRNVGAPQSLLGAIDSFFPLVRSVRLDHLI